jgi:hypothetical protein
MAILKIWPCYGLSDRIINLDNVVTYSRNVMTVTLCNKNTLCLLEQVAAFLLRSDFRLTGKLRGKGYRSL